MYDPSDPRSALAATPEGGKTGGGRICRAPNTPKFYETPPQEDDANGRTWYARGQNFIVAYTEAKPGATFSRKGQIDEYVVLLSRTSRRAAEIARRREEIGRAAYTLAFVPPGDSSGDRAEGRAAGAPVHHPLGRPRGEMPNAAAYARPHPNIPPFQAWPEPKGGYRIRSYSLDVPRQEGPLRPHLPLHDLHGELHRPAQRPARRHQALAAPSRRFRAVLARARGRVHPRHPLAVDAEHAPVARRTTTSIAPRRRSP